MKYLATFYTHFGAISFNRRLTSLGDGPKMAPVPRNLSSSCGTCVMFTLDFDEERMKTEDIESVYRVEKGEYIRIYTDKTEAL